jgi:hypothetical protein
MSAVRLRNASCPPFVWIDGTPATAGYLDVTPSPPRHARRDRGLQRRGLGARWSCAGRAARSAAA